MRVPVVTLRSLIVDLFVAAGCQPDEAQTIAEHLLAADLAGHPSHGVVRVRRYLDLLAADMVVAGQTVETISDNGPLVVLDGGYGFGQTVGRQAVEIGVERATRRGCAVVALRHSGHLGRIADWAEQATRAGLVSIHFVNVTGVGLVAPFGGRERRFGTNPVAIGIPQLDRPPILIDFATSVVAEGKARVALNGGKALPPDALIGPDGQPTDDTAVLYGEVPEGKSPDPRRGPGALRAMGDQKGSALALACEILAGVLTGSGVSGDEPFCNGMLSIYLSPDHFGAKHFVAQATDFADHVRASAPAATANGRSSSPGTSDRPDGSGRPDGVLVPGDLERAMAADQMANGVDLAEQTWVDLSLAAAKVGVVLPAV